jgi:hypothetical protein
LREMHSIRRVNILRGWRIWDIPSELKEELLEQYGNPVIDDDGHLRDYTEQDICEQLRKKLLPYAKNL